MKRVFADAVYWVALASPRDQWRGRAVQVSRSLGSAYCISMEAMRQEGITEIFTHDNHFIQEGFIILL